MSEIYIEKQKPKNSWERSHDWVWGGTKDYRRNRIGKMLVIAMNTWMINFAGLSVYMQVLEIFYKKC